MTATIERVPGILAHPITVRAGLVAAGIAILTLSAWLSVPFYPVPLTMQTLAVLMVGGLLGLRLGVSAVAGYLALGLIGAPVFHGGLGGPAVLFGPTGGYLIGFLPAALLMGLAGRMAAANAKRRTHSGWVGGLESTRELAVLTAGAVVASFAVYAVALPWLALFTGNDLSRAAAVGAAPFLLGDLLKLVVAVGAVRMGGNLIGRWRLPRF